ncbi:unnamed protein product [Mycena citricolor]|uniref:Uncharacterized protein n=1 Tax=Mycena citricolor TaxID=2018698 RepID=A0AAD2H066_9AGAR|nr:unnamed protein product [Mycena citricolor]
MESPRHSALLRSNQTPYFVILEHRRSCALNSRRCATHSHWILLRPIHWTSCPRFLRPESQRRSRLMLLAQNMARSARAWTVPGCRPVLRQWNGNAHRNLPAACARKA